MWVSPRAEPRAKRPIDKTKSIAERLRTLTANSTDAWKTDFAERAYKPIDRQPLRESKIFVDRIALIRDAMVGYQSIMAALEALVDAEQSPNAEHDAALVAALRALKPAEVRGDRGPREWLTAFLGSRFTKVVAHPVVAGLLFIGSTYALYFSPAFEWMMRNHLGHIGMLMHFLLSGYLFYWVIIGVDPSPHKIPHVGRLLMLFVTMPFHAFFGIALMNMGEPLAPSWYESVQPPWGVSAVHDLQTGGAIAWGFGEIPTFIVLIAIVVQWAVSDQRISRRGDRQAARDEDAELARYNAMLSQLGDSGQAGSPTKAGTD